MYCAVHSPIPRIVRRRVTVSSMLRKGRNRSGSASAALATAFNAFKRAIGMPGSMEAADASRFVVPEKRMRQTRMDQKKTSEDSAAVESDKLTRQSTVQRPY